MYLEGIAKFFKERSISSHSEARLGFYSRTVWLVRDPQFVIFLDGIDHKLIYILCLESMAYPL